MARTRTFSFPDLNFLGTALLLAKFFDRHDTAYLNLRLFTQAMAIIALPVALIVVQPDFGTAATFFPLVAVAMYFGGIRWRIWVIAALVVLIAIPIGWTTLRAYQKDRIVTFLNPDRDPLG